MTELLAGNTYVGLDPTPGQVGEEFESVRLASGGFVETWIEDSVILGQIFDASGAALGAPFEINSWSTNDYYDTNPLNPTIAALPGGGFVASWEAGTVGIMTRIFDASGNALANPSAITQGPGFGPYGQPTIAVLSSGDFVVAYTVANDGSADGIRAQLYDPSGNEVGGTFAVNTTTIGNQVYPLAIAMPNGGFIVTWLNYDANSYKGQVFDSQANPAGSEVDLGSGLGVFDITKLSDGNVVIVHPESDGELYGQILDATGTKIGGEFQVNAPTSGTEILPDITALSSGGFVVTWRSPTDAPNFFQQGDIHAQVFDANGMKVGDEAVIASGDLGQSEPHVVEFGTDDLAITYTEYDSFGQASLRTRLLYSAQVGTSGNDALATDHDYLLGLGGDDQLTGGPAADKLDGGSGNDLLNGGAGNDELIGGAGDDQLFGGNGNDIASYADATAAVVVNLTVAGAQNTVGAGNDALSSIEGLKGSSFDDTLTGDFRNNLLFGADGNDTLVGGSGNDALDGGVGADQMSAGDGNDLYVVDNAADVIVEQAGQGTDTVRASINYTLGDNVENLQLQGSGLIDGTGNALNNVISGTFLSNVISGLDGADRLYGFSGSDHLYGGDGDDRLEGGAGDDVLDGGNGTDQLSGDDGQDILRGGAGDDTIDGGVGIDALYGDPGRDTLIGDSGDDTLNGGAGIDRMIGGVGNDTYTVDSYGDKTIENEGEGTDRVFASTNYKLGANVEKLTIQGSADLWAYGNGLDNTLIGNTGANKLYGLAGNDTLSGGAGADWLEGGAGQDGLSGGADNDSFVFRDGDFAGLTTSTCDEIKDFTSGDKIRLNFVDANTLLGGDQAFSFIGTGAFSNTAGQLRYEQISGNTYVEGDTNGDGIADFMIKLDGLHTLVGGDFGL